MCVRRRTRYSLGRIHAALDVLSFRRDPLACLERTRAFKGSVIWTSAVPAQIIPSEEKADAIIHGLRKNFPEQFVEEGVRPLSAVHGMAWFERFVVLDLTGEEKEAVRSFIASQTDRTAAEVEVAIEDVSADQLGRL